MPSRVAAIDIGSNAIRFYAVEFTAAGKRVLAQQRAAVRLGHDVFTRGELTSHSIDSAVAALVDFRDQLTRLGIEVCRAVATSAVRDSRNGGVLVERARAAGIEIEVIAGAEEARLVHFAVRERFPLGENRWLLMDLGGGSVEMSLVDARTIIRTVSHPMGSVRLLEQTTATRLDDYESSLHASGVLDDAHAGLIATGGNIDALAGLAKAPLDGSGVARLGLQQLRDWIERLRRTTVPDRIERFRLTADRADVILIAALVYERVANLAKVPEIVVPKVGVKEGITLDLHARAKS